MKTRSIVAAWLLLASGAVAAQDGARPGQSGMDGVRIAALGSIHRDLRNQLPMQLRDGLQVAMRDCRRQELASNASIGTRHPPAGRLAR